MWCKNHIFSFSLECAKFNRFKDKRAAISMIQISNNNQIMITRGDSDTIPVHLYYGKERDYLTNNTYYVNRNDKVFFAIMEPNQRFEDAIVKKVYCIKDCDELTYDKTSGTLYVRIDSADTEWLAPGDYYYQVKLLKKDPFNDDQPDREGRPDTVIQKTKFVIVD